jgi:Spx/MgsR family transcriptional regulator
MMNVLKVYEYEKCSTCKKAIQFLDKNQVKYQRFAIVDTPPSKVELQRMLKFLDGNLKKLLNTSGVLYREMGLSEKVKTMSVEEVLDLLSKNGKLVKRPFVISKNDGWVGFNEAEWKVKLLAV